jgi:meiotic recombination protein SPO11
MQILMVSKSCQCILLALLYTLTFESLSHDCIQSMSYDADNLAIPSMKWLGVLPSDIQKYHIPQSALIPLTQEDIKRGESMLKRTSFTANSMWRFVCSHHDHSIHLFVLNSTTRIIRFILCYRRELELMLQMKVKAEIQSLSTHALSFLSEEYLPTKISRGDWI